MSSKPSEILAENLERRFHLFQQNKSNPDFYVNYALLASRLPASHEHFLSNEDLRSLAPEVKQMPGRTTLKWYLTNNLDHLLPQTPGLTMMALQREGWEAIVQEKFETAEKHFEESLEISFANMEGIAGAAAAAWYLGKKEKYESLHDLQNYVFTVDVRQFFDEKGFAELNQDIQAACISPARSTGKIMAGPNKGIEYIEEFAKDTIEKLKPIFEISTAALSKIAGKFPDDPKHPFFARKSDEFIVYSKGAKLVDNDTRLSPHIHEGRNPMEGLGVPWMLAVYYPDDAGFDEDPNRAGWLQLGDISNPYSSMMTLYTPTRQLCPKAGHLVFFPGHFRHGVLPVSGERERFSINFDFVPKDEKPISGSQSN